MKRILSLSITLTLIFLTLCACQSGSKTKESSSPEWITVYPEEAGYIYGVGTGDSGNKDMARSTATNKARVDVAKQVAEKVESSVEVFFSTSEENEEIIEMKTTIIRETNMIIVGFETVDTFFEESDRGTRVYILGRINVAEQKEALESMLKKTEEEYSNVKLDKPLETLAELIINPAK